MCVLNHTYFYTREAYCPSAVQMSDCCFISKKRKMKRTVIVCASALLVCSGLTSSARAATIDANDEWGITLDSGQSITCIAHYVWSSVEFTNLPEQIWGKYPEYENGGRWEDIGWQAALSPDNKIAYMYGPQSTNTTEYNDLGWFAYILSYQWDDVVADPNYPVYIDTALYNGPFGSAPIDYWGWRGTPGDPDGWQYRDEPYYKDELGYKEGFFSNPAPEPMTICLLGLGAAFLRKRR